MSKRPKRKAGAQRDLFASRSRKKKPSGGARKKTATKAKTSARAKAASRSEKGYTAEIGRAHV